MSRPERMPESVPDPRVERCIAFAFGPRGEASAPAGPAAGRFERLGEIARDETSVLLRARDHEVDRDVALRVLVEKAGPVDSARRFLEDAQLAAQLQHPGILSVYGMGTLEDGRPFVALPVNDGPTLADVLASTNGSPAGRRRRVALVEQVAHALAYAHARGVAHGRLTATRVHLGEKGEVAVSGWDGAVRANGDPAPLTVDVRALGLLLAAALGDECGGNLAELAAACATGDETRPRHAGEVARRIAACLAEEEAGALRAELEAARARARAVEEAEQARLERRRSELARRARRRTRAVAVAVLLAIVVAGSGLLWRLGENRAEAVRAGTEVAVALREAERHEAASNWAEARAAAAKAAAIAEASDTGSQGRARALRARIERAAAIEEADAVLIPRLEEVSLSYFWHWDVRRWDAETSGAFREAGLDLEMLDPAEAAGALRGRPGFANLLAAVDEWWVRRRSSKELAGRNWENLLEILRVADDDPWRREVRAAFVRVDRGKLRALLETADVARLPLVTCRLLGESFEYGDPATALRFLREALRRHPEALGLGRQLHNSLHAHDSWRARDLEACSAVTIALRPDGATGWNTLSMTLASRGDDAGAIAAVRKSIDLDGDSAPAWLNLGSYLSSLGRNEEAVRATRRALELEPGWPSARGNLAKMLSDLDRHEEAVALCRELIEDEPAYGRARLGHALLERGEPAAAIEACREAIEGGHETFGTWTTLAMAYRHVGRGDEAIRAIRQAIALAATRWIDTSGPGRHLIAGGESKLAGAHANLAQLLMERGKYEDAEREARAAIAIDRGCVAAHNNLGGALLGRGEPLEAIRHLEKAIALQDDDADAHSNLGVALDMLGRPREAEAPLRRAAELVPEDRRYQLNLGMGLAALGKLEGAREALEKAIALDPTHRDTRKLLAMVLLRLNLPGEAEKAFRKLLDLSRSPPKRAEGWLGVCVSLLRQGRTAEAVDAARRAVEIHPTAMAHDLLASALRSARRFGELTDVLRRAADLDPSPRNLNGLAWHLATCPEEAARKPAEAVEAARRALEAAPQDGSIQNTLGVALYRAGEFEEAVRALTRSVRLRGGGDAFDGLFLAMAHQRLGHPDVARQWYARSVRWLEAPQTRKLLESDSENEKATRRLRAEAEALLGIEPEGEGR